VAEGVHIALFHNFVQDLPLDWQKSRSRAVGPGIFKVDLVMGRVEISCYDKAFSLIFEAVGMVKKSLVKVELVLESIYISPRSSSFGWVLSQLRG